MVTTRSPFVLAAVYAGGAFALYRREQERRAASSSSRPAEPAAARSAVSDATTTFGLCATFALSAAAVFGGGYVVAESASAIAEQTGISSSIVGATLVAVATSLPEITTTYAAIRLGSYAMAVGNILGTNALEFALFLPADLIYGAGPIFAALGMPELTIAGINVALGLVLIWSLVRHSDRHFIGFGADSLLVLAVYCTGMSLVLFV